VQRGGGVINILSAIYSKMNSSALSADVGGRIYPDEALPGCEFPYVVFFVVSAVPDNAFGKTGKDVMVQFDLFSKSSGNVEITTMYSDLKALLDEATMTITSNTLVLMWETNLVTMMEDGPAQDGTERIRHWAVDYEIMTQAS
jgi:hypothetical protein